MYDIEILDVVLSDHKERLVITYRFGGVEDSVIINKIGDSEVIFESDMLHTLKMSKEDKHLLVMELIDRALEFNEKE